MLFLVGRSRVHTVITSLRRSFATETMLRTALFTGRPLCNCYGKVMFGKQIKVAWQHGADDYCLMVAYRKQLTTSALNRVEGTYGQRWTISALNWAILFMSPTIATSRSKGTKLTIIVMEILSGRFYSCCILLHVSLAVEASNSLGLLIVGQVYLKLNPYSVAPSCVAWEGGGSSRI